MDYAIFIIVHTYKSVKNKKMLLYPLSIITSGKSVYIYYRLKSVGVIKSCIIWMLDGCLRMGLILLLSCEFDPVTEIFVINRTILTRLTTKEIKNFFCFFKVISLVDVVDAKILKLISSFF